MPETGRTTRKIVRIDEDRCDGCGLCVPDCAEGAIQVIDGKARLVGENLCDGLGACLGACPKDAITIEERPADAFDEAAVEARRPRPPAAETGAGQPACAPGAAPGAAPEPCGCPGAAIRRIAAAPPEAPRAAAAAERPSRLGHWPVQLALLPAGGDVWRDADVLIAADCVAFAMPDFHERLLAGKTLAVSCPKLDDIGPYVDKLAGVFANSTVKSITVAHMEVPCCTGIVRVVREALERAGRADMPLRDVTVGVNGTIVRER